MRRWCGALLAAVVILVAGAARAAEFELPGLAADADAYAASLTAKFPAGSTPAARIKSVQAAADATRKRDFAAAAAAWEMRIGQGDAEPALWLSLAQAQMRRTPPEAARALQAAWENFAGVDDPVGQIPALLIMVDALKLLDRPAQAMQALQAVTERAPDEPRFRQMLVDLRRATGLLVKRVRTEPEAEPARACIAFTVAPTGRSDFHPGDWVRLEPPLPDAAVTRENDELCVSGLPSGATTRLILKAGLPGQDDLALTKDVTLSVAMPDRAPSIALDTRFFVLPRGQTPSISLTTVNLSAVSLRLARLSERNIVAFVRRTRLGAPVDGWEANNIAEETGRVVWEGRAAIPKWTANRPARTNLPIPEALATSGPGLYALSISPGDGTPGDNLGTTATQMILRTDLAPTVWRGSDGLTVQVRGYADVRPHEGVRLELIADNNDILAETRTDAEGLARFAAPLLHGEGPLAPRAVFAFGAEDDFTTIDLNAAAFDLSDRGVAGQPAPGPLDAYVWLDRGIYRPGETVQVMALLRDAAGAPAEVPAKLIVKRPNGDVFFETTPAREAEAALHVPVMLSNGAAAGTWTVEVRIDPAAPPIGQTSFRVDAFVPDRMAVDLGPAAGPIVPGKPYSLPLAARFLYGAPGAGLSGKGSLRLAVDPAPFPALAGYRIGLAGENFTPDAQDLAVPDTDAQGRSAIAVTLAHAPDTTHAVKAEIDAEIDDPAGHASRASIEIPVRPAGALIGIKPLFAADAIDAGTEAAFEIGAVNADGARIALKARLRLVREIPDWRLVFKGRLASYETVWRDEPLETSEIAIPADAPLHYAKRLDFGRYRVEVTQAEGGLAATSVRFRSGFVTSDNPDVPDQVDISVDRALHAPGETARIHVAPPFAGEATVLVLTDRVHSVRNLAVAAGGADIDVPVSADWGPGAYVTVHLFRPGADGNATRPARAIGLTWVGIDPATRKIDLAIDVPDKLPPRALAKIPVRATPGAWVSLAAVDEGILRLTRFESPDPAPHFLGRRTLGLDIRDDWGRLIPPGEGEATLLRQGGDEGGFVLPDVPIRTVALFVPPVQAGADGRAEIALDLPDFAGQVRLMAVAWSGTKIGAAQADVLVRDPLVAEPLLPRFLAPGDEARFSVLMQNLELPPGEASADVSVDGPLSVTGPTRLAATLASGAQAVPNTVLRATGAGRGVVKLDVNGQGGFHVHRETAITIRPARGPLTLVSSAEIPAGAEQALAPPIERFIPGSWRASATLGGAVRYDAGAMVQALDVYPMLCLEQATSRGFPLALLQDGPVAGADRAGRLQTMVATVLDRQRYDGGFGLWSAAGEAEPWLSAYATDFLLRARAAGAAVAEPQLQEALKFLGDQVDNVGNQPADLAAEAYDLYVLAEAGKGRPGAARVLAERLDQLPTPLARAQIAAALGLAHDRMRAEAAFNTVLAGGVGRTWWSADFGTALRDQLAITLLLKESGLLSDRLAKLLPTLPGADLTPANLNTQEESWAAATAAVLGHDGRPARIAVDGKPEPPLPVIGLTLTGKLQAKNLDDRPVWRTVSITGVPLDPAPAARNQMRVTRKFLALDGSALDLDHLKQNTVFVLLLEGKAEDGQDHRALLLHGLPAGWELAGRFAEGDAPGLSWLGKLSATEAQPAADDRYAAVLKLTPEAPDFRVAVRVRAVTPGVFELPGAELADMYRPGIFARQNTGRITVLPVE